MTDDSAADESGHEIPHGRERSQLRGLARARALVIKVIATAIRGTRNMREARKHVTRFGDAEPEHDSPKQ